jgi:ATP-dependent Clp protease protease subunit
MSSMTMGTASGTVSSTWPWPPEVPPHWPPTPPRQPTPAPAPILPTWEEPDPAWTDRLLVDRLLEQRLIMVGGSLDDTVANRVTAQLLLLDRADQRPIELHVSCDRAELGASIALADAIDLVSAEVHAVVRGQLVGPAVAVLCAAQQRAAHRHAMFRLQMPPETTPGTAVADELATRAERYRREVAQVVNRVATVAGREERLVDDDFAKGRLLSAEEALGYGLVTQLL